MPAKLAIAPAVGQTTAEAIAPSAILSSVIVTRSSGGATSVVATMTSGYSR